MKRTLLICIAIFGLILGSFAHPVDLQTAKTIATKFTGANELQLATTYQTDKNIAAVYVFNTTDGFVIVSADDCETPIIGYSHEGRFDPNNVPVQMEEHLQYFVERIQYGIENQIVADEITARQWELVKVTGQLNGNKAAKAVGPLLTDKWNQGCRYNSLCPTMQGPCDHAEVGCVAMAMGQIMNFHSYPATGWGTNSYTNLGQTISANFGNTTYDWEHMPDSLTENSSEDEIEAVATLLYHCGVAVNMRYGLNGSLASSTDVSNAMVRHFDYSKQIHLEKRDNFNDEEWLSLMKNNLDQQLPIMYFGKSSSDNIGHAFVCDGYDANGLFHFNWGWGVANGFFALGNMNPLGIIFDNSHSSLFDIIPQYDPCVVNVIGLPSNAGSTEGAGHYHIGANCTLTATPSGNYDFYCWKKDGQIVSDNHVYTFSVESDTINMEAWFYLIPVGQITANYAPEADNPNSQSVRLSWSRADTEWILLKEFDAYEECSGVTTDGEHIYVTYAEWNSPPFAFGKYTMNGDLLERFNLRNNFDAVGLDFDGSNFYCNTSHSGLQVLFQVDLDNKSIIDSICFNNWFGDITYDPEYDGFWLHSNYQIRLYNRQCQILQNSPTSPDFIYGSGCYTAKDGSHHLLITRESGVYDYDIANNFIFGHPLMDPGWDYTYGVGACTGKYQGKDALFVAIGFGIRIYEIKCRTEHIISYRIYRADSHGNTVTLAEEVTESSYLDTSWNQATAGTYRFGISELYCNGTESEIIWSDYIEKTGFGIGENGSDTTIPTAKKVFEDGQIVLIKDGKRYTVTGQELR